MFLCDRKHLKTTFTLAIRTCSVNQTEDVPALQEELLCFMRRSRAACQVTDEETQYCRYRLPLIEADLQIFQCSLSQAHGIQKPVLPSWKSRVPRLDRAPVKVRRLSLVSLKMIGGLDVGAMSMLVTRGVPHSVVKRQSPPRRTRLSVPWSCRQCALVMSGMDSWGV